MHLIFKVLINLFAFYMQNSHANNIISYRSEPSDILHTTEGNRYESMLCMQIHPQHSLNVDYITGEWYGNEIIMHTQDVPGIFNYDSCVEILLSDITDQMQNHYSNNNYRHTSSHQYNGNNNNNDRNNDYGNHLQSTKYLRLVWRESDDNNLEYTFNYTTSNPGLWTNIGEQRGSLVALNHYIQFTGTVQVVKAVNDHLVLTFCGSGIRSSIYTIILSRKPHSLTSEEILSVRNLLARRGLSTDSIRKVCVKSGAAQLTSMAFGILLGIFTMLRTQF